MGKCLLTLFQIWALALSLGDDKRLPLTVPVDILSYDHFIETLRVHAGRDAVLVIYDEETRVGIHLCRRVSYKRFEHGYALFRMSSKTFDEFIDIERVEIGLDTLDLEKHPGFVFAMRGEVSMEGRPVMIWRDGVSGVHPEAFYLGLVSSPNQFYSKIKRVKGTSVITRHVPESILLEELDWFFEGTFP